jgi:hypothetical protein
MRFVLTVVEQLDRAARELVLDHPINNRLALILVDNAVELIIHHRLQYHLGHEKLLQRLSPKQRIAARDAFLEGRIKVIEFLGDITEVERAFIKICHNYRSELYHVGLIHERIIRAIAGCYFDLACDLFVRLPRGFRSWGSDDRYTEIARKYIGEVRSALPLGVDDAAIADKLRAELPRDLPELQSTLGYSALDSIEQIEGALEFLVQDNPAGNDEHEILRVAQQRLEFTRALAREGIEGTRMTPGYNEAVARITEKLRSSWRQRHISLPSSNWKIRACNLQSEPDRLIALAIYQQLRNDMAYLEEALSDLAMELDTYIQLEIDRRRGK